MRERVWWSAMAVSVMVGLAACESSDEDPGPGGAGKGGASVAGQAGSGGKPSGDAGGGSDQPGECDIAPTLAGGTECSWRETCDALDCGAPWSLYDASGCRRTECTTTGICPSGQRCVPAPVAGQFEQHCFQDYDACSKTDGGCECLMYAECYERAVCLSEDEFPPERDCPIEKLDCAALERAAETLGRYIRRDDSSGAGGVPGELAQMTEDCSLEIEDALRACED